MLWRGLFSTVKHITKISAPKKKHQSGHSEEHPGKLRNEQQNRHEK